MAALDHVRHPRARVFINRQAVAITPISADVISNNYYAADTFRVTLAYSALPPGLDAKYFADADAIECEVQYQLEPVPKPQTATAGTAKATASADTAWTSMIIGRVDEADINFSEYEIVLVGRDYSSVFMDEQTSDKFANQTSSEIVASIVDKHSAEQIQKAITATKAPVGTYFPTEHAQVSRQVTQWQLMSFLAEQEGFDLFMKGRTLHFEPSHQQGSPVYAIRYTPPGSGSVGIGTLQTLIATRSMTVAKDVQVTVLSWNSKQGRAVKVTVKKSRQAGPAAHGRHTAGIPGGSTAQRYVFRVPGLTEQQATDLANKKLAEISRHERIVEGMGPADLVLQPRMMVRLQATGTAFDQDYFCDAVERSMSFHEGFVMRIRLKNHSPESQVAL